MEDDDPLVRGRAGAAARQIMGVDFHFRANDPPEKRAKALAAIKSEYQAAIGRYKLFYAEQEE